MKKLLLSYDIIDGKHTDQEIWDALYEMPKLVIKDKPTMSTLVLESDDEAMWIKIPEMLNKNFRHLRFAICRIGTYTKKDGSEDDYYLEIPNTKSQNQIKEYIEKKSKEGKTYTIPRITK